MTTCSLPESVQQLARREKALAECWGPHPSPRGKSIIIKTNNIVTLCSSQQALRNTAGTENGASLEESWRMCWLVVGQSLLQIGGCFYPRYYFLFP